jgi:hypothetical protein
MDEQQLRAIVREVVRRRLQERMPVTPPAPADWSRHPSHTRFNLLSGGDADGPCFIEPAVSCTHCSYCQSRGY